MARRTFAVAALMAAMMISTTSHAKQLNMIFWYPGEAGTSEEAQPLIDAFLDYLNVKIAPDRLAGRYINTVEEGLSYIRTNNPCIGIVSYAAWMQNRQKFPKAAAVMSTLQTPGGGNTQRYALYGSVESVSPKATVLSSEPLSAKFVKTELFPDIPDGASFKQSPQMLFKLRAIGEGKSSYFAILTPSEAGALSRLSAPWASGLKRIALSKPVPTARVVLFDASFDASRIMAALEAAGSDPKAAEILSELRLKGFSR